MGMNSKDHARSVGRMATCLCGLVMLVGAAAAGCATSPPSRFYLLTPIAQEGSASGASTTDQRIAIGVGPVDLPDYLNRPQIVTRESSKLVHDMNLLVMFVCYRNRSAFRRIRQ